MSLRAQLSENFPPWVELRRLAVARVRVQVGAAVRAETSALFSAERVLGEHDEELLSHHRTEVQKVSLSLQRIQSFVRCVRLKSRLDEEPVGNLEALLVLGESAPARQDVNRVQRELDPDPARESGARRERDLQGLHEAEPGLRPRGCIRPHSARSMGRAFRQASQIDFEHNGHRVERRACASM